MNKKSFLEELKVSLAGEVSEYEIRSNIEYYNNYIIDEMKRGRTEAEVLTELGDPSLLARTIIDTSSMQTGAGKRESSYTEQTYESASARKGFHAEYDEEEGLHIKYGKLKLNTWYGKLMVFAIVLLVIFLAVSLVVGILSFLVPVILPVLIVLVVVSAVRSSRR